MHSSVIRSEENTDAIRDLEIEADEGNLEAGVGIGI
jgi:hypothetical protein